MTMSALLSPYCGAPPSVFSTLTTNTGLAGRPLGSARPVSGEISTSFLAVPLDASGLAGSLVPPSDDDEQAVRVRAAAETATSRRNFMPPSMPHQGVLTTHP